MGMGFGGVLGLIILIADIWAIVKTLKSSTTTGMKVFWVILILILPLIGLIVWLFAGPSGSNR